jgi:hypothetical protein
MKKRRLLIIGFIVLISIGRIMPMTVFPEPWDPWYIEYTTLWFIAAGFIFLPSGLVSELFGLFSLNWRAYLIVDAIWLIALCLIIYHVSFQRNKTKDEKKHLG